MKYLSICSGIEAASVAWKHLGWKAFAFSEVEPFPCAVLKHHWPEVPNLGDMTKFDQWEDLHEVDLLVGGTPCQAFSVAGLRNSLDDERGNLTLTYTQILNKIDHERSVRNLTPAICLWENVPGVLSTKDNAFGCFLGALAGEDEALVPPGKKWSNAGVVYGPQRAIAWRVLDAQYFGVAQRRRRVFVVASARDGFCPEQVLFEFNGVRRDSPPSRKAGQGTATGVGSSSENSCEPIFLDRAAFNQGENAQFKPVIRQDGISDALVARGPHAVAARMTAFGEYVEDETASCMKQRDYKDATDLVVVHGTQDPCTSTDTAFALGRNSGQENVVAFMAGQGAKAGSVAASETTSPTLRASDSGTNRTPCVAITHCIAENIIGRQDHNGGNGAGHQEELSYTLNTVAAPAVAVAFQQNTRDEVGYIGGDGAIAGALTAEAGAKQQNYLHAGMTVRRLTPTECERLQGFPDGHTLIPWKDVWSCKWCGASWKTASKPTECPSCGETEALSPNTPDGPRYKALGNSMAVPVMRWIGEQLDI